MKTLVFIVSVLAWQAAFSLDSLRVSSVVRHLNYLPDSLGSIHVHVEGGTPPYTYNWSDISHSTNTRNDLYRGTYYLTITDAANRAGNYRFSLLFEQLPVSVNDSIVGPADTIRTVMFKNVLREGIAGHLQITINDISGEKIIGLTPDSVYHSLPQFGFYINKSKLFFIAEGRISGLSGKVRKGDVLLISKENGRISFSKNGIQLASYSCQESLYRSVLRCRKSRLDLTDILSTFNKPIYITAQQQDISCIRGVRGSIMPVISGGVGPFVNELFRGAEINPASASDFYYLTSGTYTLKTTDQDHNVALRRVDVAYEISWRQTSDLIADTNSVIKNGADGWCNSSLSSRSEFESGSPGWFEFGLSDTSSRFFIGFLKQRGSSIPLCQGVFIQNDSLIALTVDQDGGFKKHFLNSVNKNSKLRISISDNFIEYAHNGLTVHREHLLFKPPVSLDLRIYTSGTVLNAFRTSYTCEQ